MLIEFSATNVLSFRDKSTLSFAASSDDSLPGNLIDGHTTPWGDRLLKSAVLYGANASGKTNLLKALAYFRARLVGEQEPPGVLPFVLDPKTRDQPSEFEIVVLLGGSTFTYGFSVHEGRVHKEWLLETRKLRRTSTRTCFRRTAKGPEEDSWKYGGAWTGDRVDLEERTRPDGLFLRTAAEWNDPIARRIHDGMRDRLMVILDDRADPDALCATISRMLAEEPYRARLLRLLGSADLGIADVTGFDGPVDEGGGVVPANVLAIFEKLGLDGDLRTQRIGAVHRDTQGQGVEFSMETQESAGTRKLFGLAGHWIDAQDRPCVLAVDELDCHMHPAMTRQLVEAHHAGESGAQLLFATHDSTLLDPSLFRRDQVWLAEKNPEGATDLYSLWDMDVRKDENYQRGYLMGRYGAIPILGGMRVGQG